MDIRDKILSFIRMRGPVLPVEVGRYIDKDLTFASAMLADLLSSKKIRISNLKVGQSKLYYAPGQETRLQRFSKHLNEKDLQTYEMLKKRLIFREKELDPLTRVSVRQLRDFARPIEVSVNGSKEIFWRWYLTPPEEAGKLIRRMLGLGRKRRLEKNAVAEDAGSKDDKDGGPVRKTTAMPKGSSKTLAQGPSGDRKGSIRGGQTGRKASIQASQAKTESLQRKKGRVLKASYGDKPGPDMHGEKQRTILPQATDEFGKMVMKVLEQKGIEVLKYDVQRKNSDIDLEIRIPSPAGDLPYYCKAKKKQRVNDSDLASAFVEGQVRKLPVLFATSGSLTKKAQEKMRREFSSITLMKI